MPTNFSTFIDDMPPPEPREPVQWPGVARRIASDAAYTLLRTAGFSATTVLMALGLPAFAFLLLVGWDLNLALAQIDNFATRFVAADAARRLEFGADLKVLFTVATGLIALVRLPGFVDDLVTTLAREPRR